MAHPGPSTQKAHMSTQQPEALRLADAMDAVNKNNADSLLVQMAARAASAELRRLSAINAELLEALQAVDVLFGHLATDSTQRIWIDNARSAIAKAEGREA